MSKDKRKKELIPPWKMPSDPVKAVFWFMHWFLKVVVTFFWIPILVMVTYETYLNWNASGGITSAIVSGMITLLVGLGVWALLYIVLLITNISTGIKRVISEMSHVERPFTSQRPFPPFMDFDSQENIVEGTITDLEEERKKRRRE